MKYNSSANNNKTNINPDNNQTILQKYINRTIRIPMRESLRSLNLSNSVSIVAYEVFRHIDFDGLEEISKYFD